MAGGVGAYTAALAHALETLGLQVSVMTSRQACPPPPGEGVAVYPSVHRWDWRIWPGIARRAREVGADWIHVQYQTGAYGMHPAVNFAPRWWQRAGLRVAWTYHDLLVPYLFPKAGTRLRRWVTEWPARASDLVVVTNEGDRIRLASRVRPRRLARIPIGSNIPTRPVTEEARRARRESYGYREETLVVGYFGFLNRSKGGLTLVRTLHTLARRHPDVRLLMIGERVGASDPTNYAYLQEVEALIQELGLAERVHWTGHQPDGEVSADLAACDVLFMPYEDGASLRRGTLMAGLAHGCAIVTTRPQDPLPELVDGRDLIYVPPGDPEAAAAAVLQLAAQPTWAQNLRANARARSALFRWETIAAEHARLYQS